MFIGPVGSYDATLPPEIVDQVAALDGVEATLGSVALPERRPPHERRRDRRLPSRHATTSCSSSAPTSTGPRTSATFDLESGCAPRPGRGRGRGGARHRRGPRPGDRRLDRAGHAGRQPAPSSSLACSTRWAPGSRSRARSATRRRETAQRLLGKGDVITGVDVVLADGVDTDEWIDDAPRRARRVAHDPGRRGRHRRVPRLHHRDQQRPHADVGHRGVRRRLPRLPDLLGGGGRADADLRTLRALGAQPPQVRRVVLSEAGVLGLVVEPGGPGRSAG